MGREEQRYATVSLLVVVAVVGLLLFIKLSPNNLLGSAIDPIYGLQEGETQTFSVTGGGEYEVTAIGVFLPDGTGRGSAILVVDGEWPGRVYAGSAIAYSETEIQLVSAVDGRAEFRLKQRTLPLPPQIPPELRIKDSLIDGETRAYFTGDRDITVTLISASFTSATLSVDGQQITVAPGDTEVVDGVTFTLFDSAARYDGAGTATFGISTESYACVLDEQNAACRGGSACCGGSCVDLPDCTTKTDGPVLLCGDRQLYCCDGEQSFIPCTPPTGSCGNGICEDGEYDDCPVSGERLCRLGTCPEDCQSTTACDKDGTCPVIECVTQPCPVTTCIDGFCVDVYGGDGGVIA